LIIPQEVFELVQEKLLQQRPAPEFKKVVMSLRDILSGEFFTEYIKKGERGSLIYDGVPASLTCARQYLDALRGQKRH
jgi:hypothetical protein